MVLAECQRRNEKAGENEEDIDANESGWKDVRSKVINDDESNRETAKTIKRAHMSEPSASWRYRWIHFWLRNCLHRHNPSRRFGQRSTEDKRYLTDLRL